MASTSETRPHDTGLWLRRLTEAPGDAPLVVCFPHAGGAASWYRPFVPHFAGRAELVAVQYPGRQDRRSEPLVDDIRRLADAVAPLLDRDRPLRLFGHSMGAMIAFEVALRAEPAHLFVSGRRAPQIVRDDRVHQRDDAGLVAEVRRLAGTDARVFDDEELVRMVLPAIRADYRAAETYRYRPGPALSCPLTALTGDADPKAAVDEVRQWGERTTGAFAMHVFPGGHFYLTEHRQAVAALVSGESPSA
ncbi:Surfactin synthase thioesterase subunit [Lentzea xinjiangensis]|uniref:Surfactin synthase thioesterase subunit n=1 Tax=Lentzea xinjiangensis TaxID=402600 RepID=A0A1H9ITQ4_9PSEU|nr:alpha/beta fold hydrolase [Lentzea xinjiangensis]SEQ77970.1 Surfactin synthase thioesterase subunit [Lentzea xinjiangensis]